MNELSRGRRQEIVGGRIQAGFRVLWFTIKRLRYLKTRSVAVGFWLPEEFGGNSHEFMPLIEQIAPQTEPSTD
jgi:hypothetical protein